MTMVFDRYPAGGSERLLALAMADHARDDGTRIWPSLDELARKTLQSRSTVQRQIKHMLGIGWLQRIAHATGRPGATNEYRINPVWIEGGPLPQTGVNLTPVSASEKEPEVIHTGVNLTPLKVIHTGVKSDERGVAAVTWEGCHSCDTRIFIEPSRTNTPLPPEGGATGFDRILAAYPNRANVAKAERRWRRLRPDADLQQRMLAAIEAQSRTPKWRRDGGAFVPELATWLRNAGWRDEVGSVVAEWWNDNDGVMAMGLRLGRRYSLAELGNAFTDDERNAHWRRYRAGVLAAAGDGPWSERRAA